MTSRLRLSLFFVFAACGADETPRGLATETPAVDQALAQEEAHGLGEILARPSWDNVDVLCVAHNNAGSLLRADIPPEMVPPGMSEASLRASMIQTLRETPEAVLLQGADALFGELRTLAQCTATRGEPSSPLPVALLGALPERAQHCDRRLVAAEAHTLRCDDGGVWQLIVADGVVVAASKTELSAAEEVELEAAGNSFGDLLNGED